MSALRRGGRKQLRGFGQLRLFWLLVLTGFAPRSEQMPGQNE